MVNESDMNEKSARAYTRNGKVYAKDGGLMAIRCMLDDKERCTNGNVRGVAWKDLMDPVTNIELGARELAHWREGGGVMTQDDRQARRDGTRYKVTKNVPCHHKTHAWWAHYNHGPRYIDKGYARHYPHRVAVLDHAFATVMNAPAPELDTGRITIHDPGKRERTPDRPLEPRFKKLYRADPVQRHLLGARAELTPTSAAPAPTAAPRSPDRRRRRRVQAERGSGAQDRQRRCRARAPLRGRAVNTRPVCRSHAPQCRRRARTRPGVATRRPPEPHRAAPGGRRPARPAPAAATREPAMSRTKATTSSTCSFDATTKSSSARAISAALAKRRSRSRSSARITISSSAVGHVVACRRRAAGSPSP